MLGGKLDSVLAALSSQPCWWNQQGGSQPRWPRTSSSRRHAAALSTAAEAASALTSAPAPAAAMLLPAAPSTGPLESLDGKLASVLFMECMAKGCLPLLLPADGSRAKKVCNVFASFCTGAELKVLRPPGEGEPDARARSEIVQKLLRLVNTRFCAAYAEAIAKESNAKEKEKMVKLNAKRQKKRKLLASTIEEREKELKRLKVSLIWSSQASLEWRKAREEAEAGGSES